MHLHGTVAFLVIAYKLLEKQEVLFGKGKLGVLSDLLCKTISRTQPQSTCPAVHWSTTINTFNRNRQPNKDMEQLQKSLPHLQLTKEYHWIAVAQSGPYQDAVLPWGRHNLCCKHPCLARYQGISWSWPEKFNMKTLSDLKKVMHKISAELWTEHFRIQV